MGVLTCFGISAKPDLLTEVLTDLCDHKMCGHGASSACQWGNGKRCGVAVVNTKEFVHAGNHSFLAAFTFGTFLLNKLKEKRILNSKS